MNRIGFWIATGVIAAGFAGAGCAKESGADSETAANQQDPVVSVTAAEARFQDLTRRVSLSGKLEPLLRVELASPMQGILKELPLEEGDRFEAGDLLARFDVAEQEAQFRRARVQLEQAELTYLRSRDLRAADIVSISEFELAEGEMKVRQSDLDLWKTRLGFGKIKAPFDGVVTAKYAEAGSALSLNQPVLEVADRSLLVVRVGMSELDVIHLADDEEVVVRLDPYPALEFQGRVRRIFPSAHPRTRLFPVEIAIDPAQVDVPVRFGFLARVSFELDQRPPVLTIPADAVRKDGEETFVFLIRKTDSRLERRLIQAGVERSGWREILVGLEAGERVVVSDSPRLRPGATARVVRWSGGRVGEVEEGRAL